MVMHYHNKKSASSSVRKQAMDASSWFLPFCTPFNKTGFSQRWTHKAGPKVFFCTSFNRPLPSSKNPHFQNEARCTNFLVEMSLICMRMKNDFHIKG